MQYPLNKQHIQSIGFVTGIGDTPARVGMIGKGMQINDEIVDYVPKEYWGPVMLHEEGHIAFNTTNEGVADIYMIDAYVQKGGSPKTAIYALADMLNPNNPEHLGRMYNALRYAIEKYGSSGKQAVRTFMQSSAPPITANFDGTKGPANELWANLSIGSPMRKKARLERKRLRNEAKANLKNAQAEATRTLAQQGIAYTPPPSGVERVIGGIANAAASIFGGGGSQSPEPYPQQGYQAPPPVTQRLSNASDTSVVADKLGAAMQNMAAQNAALQQQIAMALAPKPEPKKKETNQTPVIIAAIVLVAVVIAVVLFKKR